MRRVDDAAIRTHGAIRFRSPYHYAVFEYWRSAKPLRFLEQSGVRELGRVLDDGCGGGGMCVSLAEEAAFVVGLEPTTWLQGAGSRLAAERSVAGLRFLRGDGTRLPFQDGSFDLVMSHAVIEHVAEPGAYLREAFRVLRPGGLMFLETAPYLSPSGAHLPRWRVPVPWHLIIGRWAAFRLAVWTARHAPGLLNVPPDGSSFVTKARRGEVKADDLLFRVTVDRLRRIIDDAGFEVVREDLHLSRLARRVLPRPILATLARVPVTRDIIVTNMEYLLRR